MLNVLCIQLGTYLLLCNVSFLFLLITVKIIFLQTIYYEIVISSLEMDSYALIICFCLIMR